MGLGNLLDKNDQKRHDFSHNALCIVMYFTFNFNFKTIFDLKSDQCPGAISSAGVHLTDTIS